MSGSVQEPTDEQLETARQRNRVFRAKWENTPEEITDDEFAQAWDDAMTLIHSATNRLKRSLGRRQAEKHKPHLDMPPERIADGRLP